MPLELINGLKTHWVHLPAQSTSSPPQRVVLLHGLLVGNLASWYLSVAPKLSERAEVLMYDLRGHGKSAPSAEGFDLPSLASDLNALLERVGWAEGPLTLIGHSYGGRVALEWALEVAQQESGQQESGQQESGQQESAQQESAQQESAQQERLERLVFVDTPLLPHELSLTLPPLSAVMRAPQGEAPLNPEALLSLLPAPLRVHFERGGRQARRALERWWSLLYASTLTQDLKDTPPLSAKALSPLGAKLAAVYGARSPCLSSARWLQEALSSSGEALTLELIEGAGHYLPSEAPQALTEALIKLLHNAEGTR
jgi:pimeloyl-ACP methyl ester carboxylesterase